MRIPEAVGLERDDVDLDAGVLTVRLTKFGASTFIASSGDCPERSGCGAQVIAPGHACTTSVIAIRTLLDRYREGKDVEQQLPVLSTYLGHACVRDTYWELSACPELMEEAVRRLDRRWEVTP